MENNVFQPLLTPVVILAEGFFGSSVAKMATGVLRYGRWPVVAVIDSAKAGQTVSQVLPHLASTPNADVPIVSSLADVYWGDIDPTQSKAMILGTAPIGGTIPLTWRETIKEAISEFGLSIINGMHQFLNDDAELSQLAQANGLALWDVRDPDQYDQSRRWQIAKQAVRSEYIQVVTMIGSDCSVGKMFTALELTAQHRKNYGHAEFVATGQTGIVIEGRGVPLDRVIADYMAGQMESCIDEIQQDYLAKHPDAKQLTLYIEGQGSLFHPAYSGVTMGLLHGSRPDAMVLCHTPGLSVIKGGYHTPIPSLRELIAAYESAAAWPLADRCPQRQPRVVGISLNTAALSEQEAREAIVQAENESGLPTSDPVRFGMEKILSALQSLGQ